MAAPTGGLQRHCVGNLGTQIGCFSGEYCIVYIDFDVWISRMPFKVNSAGAQ